MSGSVQDMLASVYADIQGAEKNQSLAPITLDHMLQESIDGIIGGGLTSATAASTPLGANKVPKIVALQNTLAQAKSLVAQVKSVGGDKSALQKLGLNNVGQGGGK